MQDRYTQTAAACSHGNLRLPRVCDGIIRLHCREVRRAIIPKVIIIFKLIRYLQVAQIFCIRVWSRTQKTSSCKIILSSLFFLYFPTVKKSFLRVNSRHIIPSLSKRLAGRLASFESKFSSLTLRQRTACCRWLPHPPVPAGWTWTPPCASDLSWCRTPRSRRGWQRGCRHLWKHDLVDKRT